MSFLDGNGHCVGVLYGQHYLFTSIAYTLHVMEIWSKGLVEICGYEALVLYHYHVLFIVLRLQVQVLSRNKF